MLSSFKKFWVSMCDWLFAWSSYKRTISCLDTSDPKLGTAELGWMPEWHVWFTGRTCPPKNVHWSVSTYSTVKHPPPPQKRKKRFAGGLWYHAYFQSKIIYRVEWVRSCNMQLLSVLQWVSFLIRRWSTYKLDVIIGRQPGFVLSLWLICDD